MMKTFKILKAATSQDMNMFKYSTKKNASKIQKILFPVMLFLLVCFSIGFYAAMIGKNLYEVNLSYILLTLFVFIVSILSFMQGIYKSQGILFEAKDNDLLFSLPIKKSQILFVRIFKLILFQYIYNLMFLLPAFAVYIYFEHPEVSFYLISLLEILLIPIIPTVISSFIGYLVKLLSSKFKAQKIMQTILSILVFMMVFYFSFHIEDYISDIANKANSINEFITSIYYPVGLYINLINDFKLGDLVKLLVVNLVPLLIFIWLGAHYYFKIIFNSKVTSKSKKKEKYIIRKSSVIKSLTIKELKRYFSSPILMFNTAFGLILILILTILIVFKGNAIFDDILASYNIETNLSLPILFYFLVLFSGAMTSISSSSISLEGRTINITKSLPVREESIINAKILMCMIIELPFLLVSDLIFIIFLKPKLVYALLIIILSFVIVFLNAVIGLIVNLKYPKLNATNDTEVVKQSISSMVSVFIGMALFIGSIIIIVYLSKYLSFDYLLVGHILILIILSSILYGILLKYGKVDYRNLNV